MKKIFSILVLVVALFITSCGATAPELLEFIVDEGSGVDYGGIGIIISSEKNGMNEKETAWLNILNYDTNTGYGDAILSRVADIEKNLGVKISYDTEEDGAAAMKLKLMAGAYIADMVNYTSFGGMENFAAAGMLHPMTGFEHIDLSETWKYGDANVLEGAMVNSVPYAVQPISWPKWEATGITSIIYNMDILEEISATDPHEFWENLNWYWDTFEETYLKGVSMTGEDEWVMSASEKLYYYAFAYANDIQYVSAGSDGSYVVNTKPQALIEALEEASQWYKDYGNDKLKLFSDYWTHEDFDEELALFTISNPTLPGTSDVRCGLMPFPCGPSNTYGRWCQAFDRIAGFGIPVSSIEPDVAAHVLSELFEPLDEYLGPLEDYYKEMIFNTEVDAEIYMELVRDARYDYTFHGGSDLMRAVNNSFSGAIKAGRGAVETADMYSSGVAAIVNDYILPNYDYMYKNYYSKLGE